MMQEDGEILEKDWQCCFGMRHFLEPNNSVQSFTEGKRRRFISPVGIADNDVVVAMQLMVVEMAWFGSPIKHKC